MLRDKEGRLILDNYQKLNDYITGRKKKVWLSNETGKKFLFKTGGTNYEIYAELISCELARQCGFLSAFYDLAILNGETGVVTPSFLKKGDIIISGEQYLNNARIIALQNNLNINFKENSIDNILNAVAIQEGCLDDIAEIIMFRLFELWCFDLAIVESDRNSTNWSIIRNINGYISLAPIYDCSTMCLMNNDVEAYVSSSSLSGFMGANKLYNLIDSAEYSLKISNTSNGNFYEDFEYLCKFFPNEMENIMHCLDKIDVSAAVSTVEARINGDEGDNDFKFPWYVESWLNKVIKIRLETMRCILNNSKGSKGKKYTR